MSNARYVIGVDVGGTYTDVFFLDEGKQTVEVVKVPSTRGDQSVGFVRGIRERLSDFGDIATVVHGTTVGTNALLERKVARTGVITTEGFRDVLEMRRRDRPRTWGLRGEFKPVIERDLRVEVPERVLADGSIAQRVNVTAVKEAAKTLAARGAQSVCVFFINAYANDDNERRALAAVRSVWPNEYVSAASAILPEIREFERASTASLNAALQPVVGHYLRQLEASLREAGFGGEILIVQSNGGVMSVDTACQLPVRTALSGPAAGVIACAHIATQAGFPNVITGDMGGTSFDVSLIADGESALAAQTAIDFGMVVRTPMIEITTIGAGGGSIAWIDRSGLLQIGPESAGSDPGPVCFAKGNDRPTVTDANVVLGRINAERPIGKLPRLDVEAAKRAIDEKIAKPLKLDVMAAAEAIVRVANANMAGAIRLVSIERGHDPEHFALMPFGGGGALHVCALMREVGLRAALVPRYPGVTSALGCTIADMRHDTVKTLNRLLDELDLAQFEAIARDIAAEGEKVLGTARVRFSGKVTQVELEMLFVGQTHTVSVPLDWTPGKKPITREAIRAAFERRYREVVGEPLEDVPVRVMNVRIAVIGKRSKFDLAMLAPREQAGSDNLAAARLGARQVYFGGRWVEAVRYDRLALGIGTEVNGPALFEQPDTTIWLEPQMQAKVDRFGNLVITRAA